VETWKKDIVVNVTTAIIKCCPSTRKYSTKIDLHAPHSHVLARRLVTAELTVTTIISAALGRLLREVLLRGQNLSMQSGTGPDMSAVSSA
jgi:hypothetical protein